MEPRIDLMANELGVKIAKRFAGLSLLIEQSPLPKATQNLVMLRASQINGCGPCIDMGTRSARKGGETEERLNTVAAWRHTPYFTEAERAALALTEAVTNMLVAQPHAARLLIREAMDGGRNGPAVRAQLAERVHEVLVAAVAFLEDGQREKVVRPELDARHLVVTLIGMHFLPFLIDRSVEDVVGRSPFDPAFVPERSKALRSQIRALLIASPG